MWELSKIQKVQNIFGKKSNVCYNFCFFTYVGSFRVSKTLKNEVL